MMNKNPLKMLNLVIKKKNVVAIKQKSQYILIIKIIFLILIINKLCTQNNLKSKKIGSYIFLNIIQKMF